MTTRTKEQIEDDIREAKIDLAYNKKKMEYSQIELDIYLEELKELKNKK